MIDAVIDLSHWETVTDWGAIKKSGIAGVIYKATEGQTYIDTTYHDARASAEATGLLWGAYHFLRPGDLAQQAVFFVDSVGYDLDLYCADHEDSGVSIDDLKEFLTAVCRLTGRYAVIYSGHVLKEQVAGLDRDDELAAHRLWIAHYTDAEAPVWPTNIWSSWWLWQYTETGAVPGIEDETDRNRYHGSLAKLKREWKKGGANHAYRRG